MKTQTPMASLTHPKTMARDLSATGATSLLQLLMLLVLAAVAQAQFDYTTINGTISITGYNGPGGDVTIPSTIEGLPVTSIGELAFVRCASVSTVAIPESVTRIGDRAFAFCASLTAITVDTLNSAYCSMDGVLFNKNLTTLIQFPGAKVGAYAIPASVTCIGDFAFNECGSLTNVTIGTNVITIGGYAFCECPNLTSVTIPSSVTNIAFQAFAYCSNLIAITVDALNPIYSSLDGVLFDNGRTMLIQWPGGKGGSYLVPNSVISLGNSAFAFCPNLTSVTLGNRVTSIGRATFYACYNLTSVAFPDSLTSIDVAAFAACDRLTSVTIPSAVTNFGDQAFVNCVNLAAVYFKGNAPSLGGPEVFSGCFGATVYYLPGTSGWGTTFGGRPTALWLPPLSPPAQTAEAGSAGSLGVKAGGSSPLFCFWYLNNTNFISSGTNRALRLTNLQFSASGAYTVVITNAAGAITSSPAALQVIAPVERRPVPGVKVTGEPANEANIDYSDSLTPTPNWSTITSVSLTSPPQYWFDLTTPLPPQRFYQAWQTGTPSTIPFLDLHMIPAITLAGNIGDKVRLDYIDRFGPIDAWVTLDTVTLTNTSQLYFDVSAPGQPPRLYRLVPVP